MKKLLVVIFVLFSFSLAIENKNKVEREKSGIGYQILQYQKDFGFGLNYTTPKFYNDSLALRIKSSLIYNENVQNSETVWSQYSNLSLGLVGNAGNVENNVRTYWETGLLVVFPATDISDKKSVFGIYSLFGFEFYGYPDFSYFAEIGGVAINCVAEKSVNKPIYSNGLSISSGLRFYF